MISYDHLYNIVYNQVKTLKRPSGNMGLDVLGLALTIPHYTDKVIDLDDLKTIIQNVYANVFYDGCEGEDDWYWNMVDACKEFSNFIRELKINSDAELPNTFSANQMRKQGAWEVKKYLNRFI